MMSDDRANRFLFDAYKDWVERQKIPVYEDFALNLLEMELASWPLMGVDAAFAHVDGRGDWISSMVLEMGPGNSSEPVQHMYEATFYVLYGDGTTSIEMPDGSIRSFEWHEKSLFTVPLNLRYRLHNVSGAKPARIAMVINAPLLMNTFHTDDSFIFDNPCEFPERIGETRYFEGEGTFIERYEGRHHWETNLIPDLTTFELHEWENRGAGGRHLKFVLGDGTTSTHVSEMPVGRYKKAHRHAAGAHIFQVTGTGYSLLWYEGDEEFRRVPWEHGWLYAPPEWMFHQHFNTSPFPTRYLAVIWGNIKYPFWESRVNSALHGDRSVKESGGRQIEYEDERPEIYELYVEECRKAGIDVNMEEFSHADR